MYLCSSISIIKWSIERLKKKGNRKLMSVKTVETWVLGVILALVGFLVTGCSLGNEVGIFSTVAGLSSIFVGSLIFAVKFKKWLDNL